VWELARRQHGVVSRRDLLDSGYGRHAIGHRLERGRLHEIHRGVYAVGRRELTREGSWMAAVLACGDEALLSHQSAAALWGVAREGNAIEVTIRRRSALRRAGVQVRCRPTLCADDIMVHSGIPTTTPARTLLDLAAAFATGPLERAVNEADKRDLATPEALREFVARHAGEPGARILRELLDHHTFRLSDSELEQHFRPIALEAGLGLPQTKVEVNGFEVDFYWPALGLVVETDGLRYHRTPSAQRRDRLRDQVHTAAGLTPLRFTHWQIAREKPHVRAILGATAARLRGGVR
jgi:very-short-patch-repair endonuclease